MSEKVVRKRAVQRAPAKVKRLVDVEDLENGLQVSSPNLPVVSENRGLLDAEVFTGPYSPNLDYYSSEVGLTLTSEEKTQITLGMVQRVKGLQCAIPMHCTGDRCPFNKECPFYKVGKAPVGKPCVVENILMDLYTKRYLDEFQVSPEASFSEVTAMTQLAATHVMEMRAWKVLGDEGNATGIIENVVGFNEQEEPITQFQEHPAYGILERAWRWRDRLLTSLVGTRKEQYKRESALKEKAGDNSLSKRAAELKSKIEQMASVNI